MIFRIVHASWLHNLHEVNSFPLLIFDFIFIFIEAQRRDERSSSFHLPTTWSPESISMLKLHYFFVKSEVPLPKM